MAAWTNYWKIVTPTSRKNSYQPENYVRDDGGGYANFSTNGWFANVLKGATTRIQSYAQYDSMDFGDVARALDIIAEEISNPDKNTDLPYQISYQTEDNQDIADTTVTTLRAALRMWCKMHRLNRRTYDIARIMIKYGDCFFRKTSDSEAWEYIEPHRVLGVEMNKDGEKLAYHVKAKFIPNSTTSREESVEVIPAAAILHFSLSNDMGPTAPFGDSLLEPVYRDWQKLQMLENAAIIYKIVRAPERRVFYIDVGNKPAHLVKQYLDQIKNEIRQRRMPNANNPQAVDGQYNPESIQEDYYFPVTAAGRGSRVETLQGGTTWETPELDHFLKKVFRALRVPTSYMNGADASGAQYNDGKVGIAYIEELRFANFIQRLQVNIEEVIDQQFKVYLNVMGLKIDPDLFVLRLPEPQNFALYRQSALDTELINSFKAIEDTPYISKRFMLKRYLGWTKEDIQMNEAMLKEEKGILDGLDVEDIQTIYDENAPEGKPLEPEVGGGVDEIPATEPVEATDAGTTPEEEQPANEPPNDEPDLSTFN